MTKFNIRSNTQYAIDPSYNAYITASAGSGKTKILIDRLLRIIIETDRAKNIVCITYTNNAANEMVERLSDKLKKWTHCDEKEIMNDLSDLGVSSRARNKEQVEKCRRLYASVIAGENMPKIQTIHSFCSRLLQIFGILNDDSGASAGYFDLLLKKALDNVLKRNYNKSALIENITTNFHTEYLLKVIKAIKSIMMQSGAYYSKFVEVEAHEAWLQANVRVLLGGLEPQMLAKIEGSLKGKDDIYSIALSEIRDILEREENEMPSIFLDIKERLLNGHNIEAMQSLSKVFLTADHKIRKRAKLGNIKVTENFEPLIDIVKTKFQEAMSMVNALKHFELQDSVTDLTLMVCQEFEQLKQDGGTIEYDDLLKDTLDLVKLSDIGEDVRYYIDSTVDYLLIDEAQDLSSLQWDLIDMITQEFFFDADREYRTIFVVGDYKQSIFSFQGANPKLFLEAIEKYCNKCEEANRKWAHIDINKNFRSGKNILRFIDDQFADWHIKHSPQLETDGIVHMHEQFDASYIAEWVASGRHIEGLQRPVQFQDIMILLRKRNHVNHSLVESLIENNVPFSEGKGDDQSKLLMQDIARIGRFAVAPNDDINTVSLLRSPLISLSEEDIFTLSYKRETTVLDALLSGVKMENEWLAKLLLDTVKAAVRYRRASSFYNWVAERWLGDCNERYKPHINGFFPLLSQFTHNCNGSIQDFLSWMEYQECVAEENNDGIRLMTMHGAKGLEAPVVILYDQSHKYVTDPVVHTEGGFIVNSKYKTAAAKYAYDASKEEFYAEERRLMYVAMTRARNELHIVKS